ncbi:biotin/lipoyl-containing protein, partial [Paraburkholderia sp. LEh10]|uniref:biotin/lipoyl-containing protein n=1 Tax=Paraburkholderia sp. LEh10 TaxID=2821353 RepID=UPI0028AA1589
MSQAIEVKVPDIGDYKDIPVIEVLVKAGDTVEKEQSLVTLESDKATMDVPSPASGTVKEVKVKLGDTVSEGTLIVLLDGEGGGAAAAKPAQGNGAAAPAAAAAPAPAPAPAAKAGGVQEVKVPDIGDYKDVPVIEIAVKVGDRVEKEQSL